MGSANPNLFVSAGEASGELYGARLLTELTARYRALGLEPRFFGMGGERMEALGCERIVRSEDVAVMGITEVIRHLPQIYREYRKLKAAIQARQPNIAVLIDFPDVNLSLAKHLKRAGIPVIYFVSPQLWAWKKYRIREVRRYVDRMLVIFPFEQGFYRERGVQATFVGHPLANLARPAVSREEFARQCGAGSSKDLDSTRQWIGLLPGSRLKEVRLNLPEMLRAASLLEKQGEYEFLLPLAPTLTAAQRAEVEAMLPAAPRITLTNDARATLLHARASVVASGTATVEAALIGNPFVVVYRVSPLSYAVAKRVVDVPHVAMVNLIAGRRAVPELIQGDFTAENVVSHLQPLLEEGQPRERMIADLREISDMLKAGEYEGGESAIDRAARITMEVLKRNLQGTAA